MDDRLLNEDEWSSPDFIPASQHHCQLVWTSDTVFRQTTTFRGGISLSFFALRKNCGMVGTMDILFL